MGVSLVGWQNAVLAVASQSGSRRAHRPIGEPQDIDIGAVGGFGPESTFVFGPEMKWRFAHVAPSEDEDAPAFHAALLSGIGLGAADYRYAMIPVYVLGAAMAGLALLGALRMVSLIRPQDPNSVFAAQ